MLVQQITKEEAWQIRQVVMWPDKPLNFIKLKDDGNGLHYGVLDQGELCTVVSCFMENDRMQFRKLATLNDKQGLGLGSFMMKFLLENSRQQSAKTLWCNARVNKKGFYEKFGLAETGKKFFKDGIEFTVMEISLL
ncbi:GNAT family N-acetyltransferase [Pedobacter sp. HMF7647]|uniref:GNAT family N-acetyltransferase n=1 Tax=Hufsiella arboris TaxID=2695275 RepID=A0A7K1Y5A4_9SPHI|nr:GNAT family N-acetyltransferase [Hufsiella arboris]MXV49765.1 GNAT family N-acetyltransferase [Hufsiella arboris]